MPVNLLDNLENTQPAQRNAPPSADALRRAAMQFEAILLMQLTSSLNGSGDDENALFGGDGGSNLAKQMFSEQLAATMADSGGIGLAELILRQFGGGKPSAAAGANKLAGLMSAVRDGAQPGAVNDLSGAKNVSSAINPASNVVLPSQAPADNFGETLVTPENNYQAFNAANVNSEPAVNVNPAKATRPRIVPDYALAENSKSSVEVNSPLKITERMNFQMPVKGRLSSGLGNRFHPIDKRTKFHAGVDIAAPRGTPINAAAEGVVTFSGWKKGYGNLVVIRHPDGRETRYGHADKLFVREGETVSGGQPIAAVGSTGKSTGPHLHFEVREEGRAVDPRKFLSNVLPPRADR